MNAALACLSPFALFSALSATGSANDRHALAARDQSSGATPCSTSPIGDGALMMPSAGVNAYTSRLAASGRVRRQFAPLPVVDGVFVHSPERHDTYTERAREHPDLILSFVMSPPLDGVDRETAHRTVLKVWQTWDGKQCGGWAFPWRAMTAARFGEAQIAIEALIKDAGNKSHHDPRGANKGGLCPHLPSNGGLLYAAAMMAAGWDGSPTNQAPGLAQGGGWVVQRDGLRHAASER